MRGFGVLLKKELKEQLKTYRFLIVAGVFILFGLSTPLMLYFLPEIIQMSGEDIIVAIPEFVASDIFSEYSGTLTQMGILVAVLIGMGTIAQERSRGTLSMTLSKPVRWGTLITAKLAAMSVVFLVSLGIASLGCYGYSAYLFEGANGVDFLFLNLLLGLYFVTCLAEVTLCSSLFKNQLAAGGLALAILIIQTALTAIPSLSYYLPNSLVNWGVDIVSGVSSSAWAAVGVSVGIICASLIASLRILELKEL